MIRIDAHHHVWDLAQRSQPWLDAPGMEPINQSFAFRDLLPSLDSRGIEATILVQTISDPDETPELLELARAEPRVVAVTGWVDLRSGDVAERIAALKQLPGGEFLKGIRHQVQGEDDDAWIARADVLAGLRAVAGHGLVYELLTLPRQLPAAVEAASSVPELRFVLDHASKPPLRDGSLATWAQDVRRLGLLPNVACKVSGLTTEADWRSWTTATLSPVVEHLLEVFHPDRLMLGSDWPVCLLAGSYDDTWSAYERLVSDLSPSEQDQLRGLTAASWYGLPTD